jgi:hypothetical protein
VLVTLPETTPVNEVIETAFALEEDVGVQLGPIVVNGVDGGEPMPDVDAEVVAVAELDAESRAVLCAAAAFRRSRLEMERDELERLSQEMPLPQIHLTAQPVAGLSATDVDVLVDELCGRGASDDG